MDLKSQSGDCSPGREQSFVFDKSDLRASCGDHSNLLRTPWSQPGLCFSERMRSREANSPKGAELTSRTQCGTYGFFTHRSLRGTSSSAAMNWASIMFLKDKWTSLCTHHFFFLPKFSSALWSSSFVSLTTCMAWNDVMPGMGLTTSSTIISWSLMAKRDQRTSIWAKGRAEGNRPHPEFMRTIKNCYVRVHNVSAYLKHYAYM